MTEQHHDRDFGELRGLLREFRAWTEGKFREIEVILTGATGDNGLQGRLRFVDKEVKALEEEFRDTKTWALDLWNVQRPANCIGQKAVTDLEARMNARFDAIEKGSVELRKARFAMWGAIAVALLTTMGTLANTLIVQTYMNRPAQTSSRYPAQEVKP